MSLLISIGGWCGGDAGGAHWCCYFLFFDISFFFLQMHCSLKHPSLHCPGLLLLGRAYEMLSPAMGEDRDLGGEIMPRSRAVNM